MKEALESVPPGAFASVASLRDEREFARVAALAHWIAAGSSGAPPVEAVAPCLSDPSRSVRELAVVLLSQREAPPVSALLAALDENQPTSVRVMAVSGLARAGPAAAVAVPELCRSLQSSDPLLRWHAGFALSKIGRSATAALGGLLSSTDQGVLLSVITALRWSGAEAREAVLPIQRVLASSPSQSLRLACESALVAITGDASGVTRIASALQHKDPDIRTAAIEQLGELRGAAGSSAASVFSCLSDPSPSVRAAAALALARMDAGGVGCIEGLTKLLQDPEAEVRANAAIALAHFGPAAAAAVPALEQMQSGGDARLAAIARAAVEAASKSE